MLDIRQTPQYAKHLKKIGWVVKEKNGVYYFIKKLSPIGSVMKIQRPETIRYQDIKVMAKSYRAFQIIIEPKDDMQAKFLQSVGFRLSKNPYLPTKTIQLDLTQTKKQLFNQLKKDARSAIRKNNQISLINYPSKSLEEFIKTWKKVVGLKRYVPSVNNLKSLKKTFIKNSLFLTDADKSCGAIFLIGDKIGYYWQAFTNTQGRKKQSQYKIVWEGILWAKNKGAKVFDFEGIYDEEFPNKSWLGFSHFKKSFGGYEVKYPGCYIKYKLPI